MTDATTGANKTAKHSASPLGMPNYAVAVSHGRHGISAMVLASETPLQDPGAGPSLSCGNRTGFAHRVVLRLEMTATARKSTSVCQSAVA